MSQPAAPAAHSIPGPGLGFVLLCCVLPVFVGGMIYLAFRDTSLLMFRWAGWLALDGAIEAMRSHTLPYRPGIPDWVLFSVPDGVWVFACTAFFARLWHDGHWAFRLFWIGLGPALAIGGELGQLPFVGLVPGTFDTADLLFYVIAAMGALAAARHATARARRQFSTSRGSRGATQPSAP
jgi:hypothetical protein